jgi:uncharacterized membrane protein
MKTENVVLMKMARESLSGKWGLAIGTVVVYFLIVGIFQIKPPWGTFPMLLIAGPMMLGISIFSLSLARNQEARLEQIFLGFNNFVTALVAYLLMAAFIILWTLLLIIPGIIAAISYSMTFYIIADNDSIGPMAAIDKSKQVMYGFKWKLFRLYLRFFGWALLCILTLGIGFLWLFPFMQVTMAKFYDDVKANQVVAESI